MKALAALAVLALVGCGSTKEYHPVADVPVSHSNSLFYDVLSDCRVADNTAYDLRIDCHFENQQPTTSSSCVGIDIFVAKTMDLVTGMTVCSEPVPPFGQTLISTGVHSTEHTRLVRMCGQDLSNCIMRTDLSIQKP